MNERNFASSHEWTRGSDHRCCAERSCLLCYQPGPILASLSTSWFRLSPIPACRTHTLGQNASRFLTRKVVVRTASEPSLRAASLRSRRTSLTRGSHAGDRESLQTPAGRLEQGKYNSRNHVVVDTCGSPFLHPKFS